MDVSLSDGKMRCFGNKPGQDYYADYHDNEWSVPERNDQKLFEMLVLEGAQAGLSWDTVLKKREGYRKAFHQFDVSKVAADERRCAGGATGRCLNYTKQA